MNETYTGPLSSVTLQGVSDGVESYAVTTHPILECPAHAC